MLKLNMHILTKDLGILHPTMLKKVRTISVHNVRLKLPLERVRSDNHILHIKPKQIALQKVCSTLSLKINWRGE